MDLSRVDYVVQSFLEYRTFAQVHHFNIFLDRVDDLVRISFIIVFVVNGMDF